MSPQELKTALGSGLLSFPLTDFDATLRFGSFEAHRHQERDSIIPNLVGVAAARPAFGA